jgi:small-conductance mechanosensitive channel
MDRLRELLDFVLIARYDIRVIDLMAALGILLGTWLIWIALQAALRRFYRRRSIDEGAQYAISQIIRYLLMVFAVTTALQSLHFQLTAIWAGAAALLVGIGLGLQQTFNDFTSGLILLFEQTIRVGDWVEFGLHSGRVSRIGPRASEITTLDGRVILVPNSKLVTEVSLNWNRANDHRFFAFEMLVNFGPEMRLALEIAGQEVLRHTLVLKEPCPAARIVRFTDKLAVVEVSFATVRYAEAEAIKSDLRLTISEAWARQGIHLRP